MKKTQPNSTLQKNLEEAGGKSRSNEASLVGGPRTSPSKTKTTSKQTERKSGNDQIKETRLREGAKGAGSTAARREFYSRLDRRGQEGREAVL